MAAAMNATETTFLRQQNVVSYRAAALVKEITPDRLNSFLLLYLFILFLWVLSKGLERICKVCILLIGLTVHALRQRYTDVHKHIDTQGMVQRFS